jgi:hypothetical protein
MWEGPLQPPLAKPTNAENGLLNSEMTLPMDHFNFHSAANGRVAGQIHWFLTAAVK